MKHEKKHIPWFLWPFYAIWVLVATILEFTGRLVGLILGMVLMAAGVIVSLTMVGAIIGIPLIIVGFLLTLRCIF